MKKFVSILMHPFVLGFLLTAIISLIINYTVGGYWVFLGITGIPLGFIIRKLLNLKK